MRRSLTLLVALLAGCNITVGDAGTDGFTPDMWLPAGDCPGDRLATGCAFGRCTVSAPLGTIDQNTTVHLAEIAVPMALATDAVGPTMCEVTVLGGAAGQLTLAIHLDGAPSADMGVPSDGLAIFGWAPPSATLLPSSVAGAAVVEALIPGAGQYGLTRAPVAWRVDGIAGVDVSSSGDRASLLRNLSTPSMSAATFDGTHLFVGSGARVLIYDGLPADPSVKPVVILGQPSLDETLNGNASSSLFDSAANAIFSDGTHLLVATGNRILLWNSIPTRSFAPADLVLGQPDFASDDPNHGGVSGASLWNPQAIDYDGTLLAVGDMLNNRVLVWMGLPTAIGQAATSVIGEPTFTGNTRQAGATPIYQAWGVSLAAGGAFVTGQFAGGLQHVASASAINPPSDFAPVLNDPDVLADEIHGAANVVKLGGGGLAVRDVFGDRVAIFRAQPTAPHPIDFVLGQPDPQRNVASLVSASSLPGNDYHLGAGGGALLVPDGNRCLVYETIPDYSFAPASRVIGQAGFSTDDKGVDYRGIAAGTMASPADVALDATHLAVADRGNNRVLLFHVSDIAGGNAQAVAIVGQPDASSYVPNVDQRSPSGSTLSGPGGVALDGTHLIVADTENHRVLVWNKIPTGMGAPADLVLGQPDMSSHLPNRGRGDVAPRDGFSDADADGFFAPTGVASDGTRLAVADRLNHRVLVWTTFPTRSGQPADLVLGQPDMKSNLAHRGNGPFAIAADGFDLATGVTLAGTSLWVADTESNRVVRWDHLDGSPAPAAYLGQASGTVVSNPNFGQLGDPNKGNAQAQPTSATSVLRPRSVALAGGRIFVSEMDSHRVHVFDATSLAPVAALGQADLVSASANAGGPSASALASPQGLATDGKQVYIADARNHRVLVFPATAATGSAASALVGQPSFAAVGFNQTSSAAGSVTGQPHGLWRDGGDLFIADTNHHRVLVVTAPATAGAIPTRVYGQPDDKLALINAGGAPSATSLASPRGVFADVNHVVIADSGNHRVLIYDRASSSGAATIVLGQKDMSSVLTNGGGFAGAGTLDAPEGVYSDGTRLFVADTGNHRVLVWSTFPTQSGQPADSVIGQASLTDALPNRGAASPSARSLVLPSSVLFVGGALLIADSGNNRVLVYKAVPSADSDADGALGQPDLTARVAAADSTDRTRLAGPVALASDGANVYVLERDLGRVMAWRVGAVGGLPAFALDGSALGTHAPHGIAADSTPDFTSRLYIADSGADRLLVIDGVSRLVGAMK